jgi:hypothetical protein
MSQTPLTRRSKRLTEAGQAGRSAGPTCSPTTVALKEIIMNTPSIFAAAALAILGTSAFALDVQNYPTPSTMSRAEVQAEAARYAGRASSQLEVYGSDRQDVATVRDGKIAPNAVTLTRAEVRRDLARADSLFSATIAGEAYGSVQPGLSLRSREAVRAEAVAAARANLPSAQYNAE